MDDDIPPSNKKPNSEMPFTAEATSNENGCVSDSTKQNETSKVETPKLQAGKCWASSSKWTTGASPRIGCVRECPTQVQFQALEQVKLSPRVRPKAPIPSPRPSPNLHLSPRLSQFGLGIQAQDSSPLHTVITNQVLNHI